MEDSNNCQFDYLEIIELQKDFVVSDLTSNQNRSTRFCGSMEGLLDGQQKTNGNFMQLRLITDRSQNRGGFRLVITATMGPSQGCGGILDVTDEWKTLTSPLKPDSNLYYSDLRCDWTLKAKTSRTLIEIRFTRLEMETKKVENLVNTDLMINSQKSTVDNCYDFVVVNFNLKLLIKFRFMTGQNQHRLCYWSLVVQSKGINSFHLHYFHRIEGWMFILNRIHWKNIAVSHLIIDL